MALEQRFRHPVDQIAAGLTPVTSEYVIQLAEALARLDDALLLLEVKVERAEQLAGRGFSEEGA